jgi:hypothetical protein
MNGTSPKHMNRTVAQSSSARNRRPTGTDARILFLRNPGALHGRLEQGNASFSVPAPGGER